MKCEEPQKKWSRMFYYCKIYTVIRKWLSKKYVYSLEQTYYVLSFQEHIWELQTNENTGKQVLVE